MVTCNHFNEWGEQIQEGGKSGPLSNLYTHVLFISSCELYLFKRAIENHPASLTSSILSNTLHFHPTEDELEQRCPQARSGPQGSQRAREFRRQGPPLTFQLWYPNGHACQWWRGTRMERDETRQDAWATAACFTDNTRSGSSLGTSLRSRSTVSKSVQLQKLVIITAFIHYSNTVT